MRARRKPRWIATAAKPPRHGVAAADGIQFCSCAGSAMLMLTQQRERGMAEYDSEYFTKQFEGLPPKAVAVVALRAAMRVLPILANRRRPDDGPFAYWKASERAQRALPLFRCYEVSLFVNSLTEGDPDASYAASDAANAISSSRPAVLDDEIVEDAAFANYCAGFAAFFVTRDDAFGTVFNAANAAAYAAARAAVTNAILRDVQFIRENRPWLSRRFGRETETILLGEPLWQDPIPPELETLWKQLQSDLQTLSAGFEIWIQWYQDRLTGKPIDWQIERQWALLSKEQLSQSPAEINAYLKALREGLLTKQLKRVRAIFIGHGEVGKTSLINVLHGGEAEPPDRTTMGVAIKDAIHKEAIVLTRVTDYTEDDLTVHYWDFGGQVMAHATHQFFLRSKCLYVIVLDGRGQRNPDEEAEYWLEHVRAFGDSAPVLLVGNKADVAPVNLNLRALKEKYPNIVDFYSISCTQAKGTFQNRFELFREEFKARLNALGEHAERFSPAQFRAAESHRETGHGRRLVAGEPLRRDLPGERHPIARARRARWFAGSFRQAWHRDALRKATFPHRLRAEPALADLWRLHDHVFGGSRGREGAAQRGRARRDSQEREPVDPERPRAALSGRQMRADRKRHDRFPRRVPARHRRACDPGAASARGAGA